MKKVFDFFKSKFKKKSLLIIEQEDINSVPVVIYKGRKINFKQEIIFSWGTETEAEDGSEFDIQYYDSNSKQILREGFSHPSKTRI